MSHSVQHWYSLNHQQRMDVLDLVRGHCQYRPRAGTSLAGFANSQMVKARVQKACEDG